MLTARSLDVLPARLSCCMACWSKVACCAAERAVLTASVLGVVAARSIVA